MWEISYHLLFKETFNLVGVFLQLSPFVCFIHKKVAKILGSSRSLGIFICAQTGMCKDFSVEKFLRKSCFVKKPSRVKAFLCKSLCAYVKVCQRLFLNVRISLCWHVCVCKNPCARVSLLKTLCLEKFLYVNHFFVQMFHWLKAASATA